MRVENLVVKCAFRRRCFKWSTSVLYLVYFVGSLCFGFGSRSL